MAQVEISSQELLSCALPTWYPLLHHLTIKSEFIILPDEFVEYLSRDGLVLPKGCELPCTDQDRDEEWTGGVHDNQAEEWNEGGDEDTPTTPSFPKLLASISSSIKSLGGGCGIFPKLNWSAPRDASWIATTNTLCCTSPAEIILLLKSSEFIAHDIARVSECNTHLVPPLQPTLCMREWKDMVPSSEFRAFVCAGELIGACQRDPSTHYPFLPPLRDQILQELIAFHQHHLSNSLIEPTNYVFDVYREQKGVFVLVDINPFCVLTDPLLYTWDELEAWHGGVPELRLVDLSSIQPSQYQGYRLPKDMVELSNGEDINKFVDLFHSDHFGRTTDS